MKITLECSKVQVSETSLVTALLPNAGLLSQHSCKYDIFLFIKIIATFNSSALFFILPKMSEYSSFIIKRLQSIIICPIFMCLFALLRNENVPPLRLRDARCELRNNRKQEELFWHHSVFGGRLERPWRPTRIKFPLFIATSSGKEYRGCGAYVPMHTYMQPWMSKPEPRCRSSAFRLW